mmetsp:Transcript_134629/g.200310  ORF Transcript_134629/g.200310 Transcript_134629/m.200310 type:complete len:470 (+) Transcript_134629:62-1471(+)
MRIQALLLLLVSAVPSSMALRGEGRLLSATNNVRRLKGVEPKEDPKQGEADAKKADPKATDPKATDPKEKDSKKCKKAKKHGEEKKSTGSRKVRGLRQLQEVDDIEDADAPYCLHGALSEEQCTDLQKAPKEAKISSDLSFELVHSSDEEPETILDTVQNILVEDTAARYVGCLEMKAEPKGSPKSKSGEEPDDELDDGPNARFLAEILYEEEEEWVDVTAVTFNSLDLVRDGCKNTAVPEGSICDLVRSDVDIYYQGLSDPTEEEVDDMKNLLIETILSQSSAGSFQSLGAVESVEVDGTVASTGNGTDTEDQERGNLFGDGEGGDEGSKNGSMKFVYAAIAAAVVFGVAYWYGTSGEDDEKSTKDRDTSDSEDDQPANNNGWMGGWVKSDEPAEATKQEKKTEQKTAAATTTKTAAATSSSSRVNSAGQVKKDTTTQKKTTSSSNKKEEPKEEESFLESVFGKGWFE